MRKVIVHIHDEALSNEARAANTQIAAIKRYADIRLAQAGDPELTWAEGAMNEIRELEDVIARAKAALDKVG